MMFGRRTDTVAVVLQREDRSEMLLHGFAEAVLHGILDCSGQMRALALNDGAAGKGSA